MRSMSLGLGPHQVHPLNTVSEFFVKYTPSPPEKKQKQKERKQKQKVESKSMNLFLPLSGVAALWIYSTVPSVGGKAQYQVQITLPSNSPLTAPIIGPLMSSKREAKAAVCLMACRELLRLGELNDNLLPSIVSEKERLEVDRRQLREDAQEAINTEWRIYNSLNPQILQPCLVRSSGFMK